MSARPFNARAAARAVGSVERHVVVPEPPCETGCGRRARCASERVTRSSFRAYLLGVGSKRPAERGLDLESLDGALDEALAADALAGA